MCCKLCSDNVNGPSSSIFVKSTLMHTLAEKHRSDRNRPGAGEGQGAGVSQADQTTGQICYGGLCRGAGSQSLQFKPRVHTARCCGETPHLSLQLPTNCNHVTPPGGKDEKKQHK